MSDDDGFITPPPGIFDSGTLKTPSRAERPRTPPREEIVFVPSGPGAPPAAPARPTEETVLPDPLAETRRDAGEDEASGGGRTPAWRLALPDGTAEVVDGPVLVGRNPAHSDAWPGARLLAVHDPAKSVSKTHAAFEVETGVLRVHDLHSTNGVWVVGSDDSATEVSPGTPQPVPPGSTVELGDLVIRVTPTPPAG